MARRLLLVCAVLVLTTRCSDDASSSSAPNKGVAAYKSVLTSLNSVGGLLVNSSARSAFGVTWDDVTEVEVAHPKDDGDLSCAQHNMTVNLLDYMGYQFDETAVRCNGSAVNVFGRVNQSLQVFCAISQALEVTGTSAEVPAGSNTIVFTSALKTKITEDCGIDTSDIPDGTPASVVVSHSDTGYDTRFSLDIGGDEQIFYLTFDDTVAKIASSETNGDGTSRVLVDLNRTTGKITAEYLSRNTSDGVYIHRLYFDPTTGLARVVSQDGGAPTQWRRYVVTGKPESTTELNVALSLDLSGLSNPAFTGNFDREACINKDTAAIISDGPTVTSGAFTCSTVPSFTVNGSAAFADTQTDVLASPTWNALSFTTAMSWSTMDAMTVNAL